MPGGVGSSVGGRYLLIESVGRGGMGRVWRAHDQVLDRDVAVKEVLLPAQVPEEHTELLARTMREARAAARLSHPGVVTVHDVVEHEGTPWIVMEFISGLSLSAEIAQNGRLPWPRVAEIGAQVADALAHAHAAGIVHRDLKPDNILLSGHRAVVTDFGIALIIDATTKLTGTGVRIGTWGYMAPEQLEASNVGPSADMWALGATLYTAVQGAPPFAAPTLAALLAAIVTRQPLPADHAGELRELLGLLLSKKAAQRPHARDVAALLANYRTRAPELRASNEPRKPASRLSGQIMSSREAAAATGNSPESSASTADVPRRSSGSPSPGLQSPASTGATIRKRGRRRTIAVLVAAVAAIAAIVIPLTLPSGGNSPSGGSPRTSPSSQQSNTRPPGGTLTATLPNPGRVDSVAFMPNGETLAAGDDNGSTYLWNTSTRTRTALSIPGSGGYYPAVAYAPDGKTLAATNDTAVYLWNTTTDTKTAVLADPSSAGVFSIAFAPDGKTVAIADGNGHVYLWDIGTATKTLTITDPGHNSPWAVAFASDSKAIAFTDQTNVYLWNTVSHSITATLTDPSTKGILCVAFAPGGKSLATGDDNGHSYLWNAVTGARIATLTEPAGQSIESLAYAPNGKILATGDFKGHIYLWNIANGNRAATLVGPNSLITSMAFTVDGGKLAASNYDGQVYLWRMTGT